MERKADDFDLVRAVLAGDAAAIACLLQRIAPVLRASCRRLSRDEAEAQDAHAAVLAALKTDGFARLKPYDGRSHLETFIALVARDILGRRVVRLLDEDTDAGWRAFDTLFAVDLERLIARRLPGAHRVTLRQDAYQDICAGLIAQDYRRLRAYSGHGSFSGFILHTADRLLIDFMRSPRTRTPAGIHLVSLSDAPDPFEISHTEAPSAASPEEIIGEQEDEAALALAARALREATAELSEAENLYIRILLAGAEAPPARDIARLMGRPVVEVYKLKQRVLQRLRERLKDDAAVKTWRGSV